MIKKIFILLFILFQVQTLYAEYNNERSAEASQVWNEIDDLEKEKPVLRAVISYCDNQLPIAKDMKSKVENYAQKVTILYKSNAIKTIISGGLSAASEIAGGISGKVLVDLGLWLTNKGISITMGNSSTFGGVSNYKRSIGNFLSANHTLTKELNNLYEISKTSDGAIQAYYNKNGRYRDLLGPLGDTGVFTTRMRLVIEQTVPAIASLKNLITMLENEKENTTSKLKQLDRRLARLKKKLKELNKEQKAKKIEEIKPKLSNEEIKKGNIVTLQPNIGLGNPEICTDAASRLANLYSRYNSTVIALNKHIKKLNSLRKNYIDEINEKKKENINSFNETLGSVPYPTGYEIPMSKRLSVEKNWRYKLMEAEKALTAASKKLASNLVTNLPGDELAKTISQELANKNYIYKTAVGLNNTCFSSLSFEGSALITVRMVDYPQMLRYQKKQMMITIDKEEKLEKEMKAYNDKVINKMRSDFKEKRKQMEDAISKYERSIRKNETFENNLMADMTSLQNLYKSGLFTSKETAGRGKNYYLKLKIKDSDTVCQTVKKIRNLLDSSNVQNVISLEKKIKTYLSYSSTYAALPIPKAAFVEFGKDIKNAQKNHMTHKNNFSIALNTYRDSSSDTQSIYNAFSQYEFYKVPQLRPLYDKLVYNVKITKSLIKNLRVEIENALSKKMIPSQQCPHLQEYYENTIKRFKKDFFCIPISNKLLDAVVEDLEDLKLLLSKVRAKPRYIDTRVMMKNIKQLLSDVENFSLGNTEAYINKYKSYRAKYKEYYTKINETNVKNINSPDRADLNGILAKINTQLLIYADNIKDLSAGNDTAAIKSLYSKFSQYYSEKNIASLMNLLSDDWESSGDGTTFMDLEDTLNNSFSVFDEIECTIDSLNITNIGSNRYRVTYVITIKGFIYDEDIEHLEKSSVNEEIMFDNKIPKIYKTLNGHYWKIR